MALNDTIGSTPTNTWSDQTAGLTGSNVMTLYSPAWENAQTNIANYGAGMPSWANDVYQNWYSGNLSAAPTQQYQGALQNMGTANPYTGQITGTAMNMTTGAANYDPSKLQQYLNPYTQQAAQATVSDINRNLNENLMPNLNTTFAGAGQFGSSRNQEFANRAYRDTQEAAAKALAQANYGAYNQANQIYSDWANRGLTAGTNVANLAGAASNLRQADLTNAMTAGRTQYEMDQASLDVRYNDWLKRQQFPITTTGALGQFAGQAAAGQPKTVFSETAQPDDLTRALSAMSILQQGLGSNEVLDSDTISNLLGGLYDTGSDIYKQLTGG